MTKSNPYANLDGSPIEGNEPEFFAYANEVEDKRISHLPANEQDKAKRSKAALADRMNS
jgi:hypothetical protein